VPRGVKQRRHLVFDGQLLFFEGDFFDLLVCREMRPAGELVETYLEGMMLSNEFLIERVGWTVVLLVFRRDRGID